MRAEAHVLGIHHRVLLRIGWLGVGELGQGQRNALAGEPAHQTVHHDEEGFVGEAACCRVGDPAGDADHRFLVFQPQFAADIVEEQGHPSEQLLHRPVEVLAVHHGMTQQCEAADLHATRIQTEELVIEFAGNCQPQRGKRLGRHASMRNAEQFVRDARSVQETVTRDSGQPRDRGCHEVHRHCVLLHCTLRPAAGSLRQVAKNATQVGAFGYRNVKDVALE